MNRTQNYVETWNLNTSKGVIDAIVDLGRDLENCGQIDHTLFDNDGSRQAIIKCVEKRIGKPFDVSKRNTARPCVIYLINLNQRADL